MMRAEAYRLRAGWATVIRAARTRTLSTGFTERYAQALFAANVASRRLHRTRIAAVRAVYRDRHGRTSTVIAQRELEADFRSDRGSCVVTLHDKSVTERVIEYIEANYAAPISLRDVAQALGYSPCHLTHTFRENTGTPITAWVIKRRIMAAEKLLRESNTTVAAAAEAVGFNDLCYFTRQFVRHVGVTPGRFRSAMNGAGRGARVLHLKGSCG